MEDKLISVRKKILKAEKLNLPFFGCVDLFLSNSNVYLLSSRMYLNTTSLLYAFAAFIKIQPWLLMFEKLFPGKIIFETTPCKIP